MTEAASAAVAEKALAPAARNQPAEHGKVGPSQQTNRPSQHREAAVGVLLEVAEALPQSFLLLLEDDLVLLNTVEALLEILLP